MKYLNNYLKASAFVLASLVVLVSCQDEFLEVEPTGSLANAQLTTKDGVDRALIGTYAALRGVFGNRFEGPNHWVLGSVLGGEANKGTDPGDYSAINPIQRYEIDPTNGDINALWRARYEGISRANEVLRLVAEATDISTADATVVQAEARMLRGHYYFDLKKVFNSIPYIDETLTDPSEISAVQNSSDVWGKIEADFQFAFDNLPETQGQIGRVNKWAAGAYLSQNIFIPR